jgi:molecular chaperone GrpE
MEYKNELSVRAQAEPGAGLAKNQEGGGAVPGVAPQVPTTPSPEAEVAEFTATIQKLRADNQKLYDRLLRKQAELDNLRKRMEREKEELREYANADLIRALLPTLDALDRALKQHDTRVPDEFYKGMELIYDGLLNVLKQQGLEPIEAVGQTFDPHWHQAFGTVEDGQHRDQEIVEELLRGYKLKRRLLRPSIVKVAVTTKTNNLLADGINPSRRNY